MAIKRWNANTSTWELVGTPGTVTPAAIGAASLANANTFSSSQRINGNVGIGTAATAGKLALQSAGDRQIDFLGQDGNTYAYIGTTGAIGSAPANSLKIRSDAGGIIFGYQGFEQARIDTSGNVGVGTSSPTSKLHVETSGTNYITSRNGAAGAGIAGLILQNSGDTRGIRINGSSLELYDHSAGTARVVIDASGNISIGTAYSTLSSTAGNSPWRIRGKYTGDAAPYPSEMISSINWNTVSSTQDTAVNGSAYTSLYAGANGASGFKIFTGGNGATPTERIHVDGAGNTNVLGGKTMFFYNPINTGAGSVFCPGGGSLTLASYNQPMIVCNEDNAIFFKVGSGTDRARFDSNGYLLIGYTSSNGAYRLQVNSQIFATSSSIATSDGRYKENVLPITSGLDIIDSLNPVSFDWKEHPVHNFVPGKTVGFIAQEVKEALKDYEWVDNIIKTNNTEAVLDEEGNEIAPAEEFLGIAESNIIPLLVAAVKELRAELNTLKSSML